MSRGSGVAVPYLTIARHVSAADVAGIRGQVRAYAAERGASRRVVAAIGLAVGEAVTNAVVNPRPPSATTTSISPSSKSTSTRTAPPAPS